MEAIMKLLWSFVNLFGRRQVSGDDANARTNDYRPRNAENDRRIAQILLIAQL
jgi:hypothetical protein